MPTVLWMSFCVMFFGIGVGITYKLLNIMNEKNIKSKELEHRVEIEKLKILKENAERECKAKDDYLANMVHDIRTPINAVTGMTELILRENKDRIINEYANSINRAGNMLNQLATNILDIAKIRSGNMTLVEDSYDIVEVFCDVVSVVKDKCNKKNLKFEVKIDERIPSVLYGDENRLRQILVNLLSNAVKYTSQGRVTFEVKLEREINNGKVDMYFAVEDTGSGIKSEDIANVFKSFQRVDEIKNSEIEGSGLGLNIVYNLLELMGSKIQVKSTYGVGSRFYFTLTQSVLEERPVGNFIVQYNEQLDKKSNYTASFVAPEANILVVDDNEMNLIVTSKLLKNTQMTIDIVKSGYECLNAINNKKYNLILMDIKMPELDGIETLERVRGGGSINKQTPIVALTADPINSAREKYLDVGFADYISKPIEPLKLEKKIRKFIPKGLIKVSSSGKNKDNSRYYLLNVKEGLNYCSGDIVMYNEVLSTYFKLGMENILTLNNLYLHNDWTNYGILAHSLKSTSMTVGAVELYEQAKKLEFAAKEGNIEYINYNHDEVINLYKKVLSEIETYFYENTSN